LIVPYNPQQIGVSKRNNIAIVGETRAMLHDQDLPMFLWEEACNTKIYLHKRSPHKVFGKMALEEEFIGHKPEIGHIHVFRGLVYYHVLAERRMKLELTAEKGIFVGYSETSKSFKVCIPTLKKTVVQRHLKFEEEKNFRKSCDSMPVEAKI
jgi:hypothetical protein